MFVFRLLAMIMKMIFLYEKCCIISDKFNDARIRTCDLSITVPWSALRSLNFNISRVFVALSKSKREVDVVPCNTKGHYNGNCHSA